MRPREPRSWSPVARRRKDREEPQDSSLDGNWWQLTGARALSAAWSWADRLKPRQRTENAMDLIHEAIYLGVPLSSSQNNTPSLEWLRQQSSTSATAHLNQIGGIVDTIVARLGRRRPMPIIGCDDAAYSEKLYARRASRVLRRKMGTPNVERMCPQVMRDTCIRGSGFVYTYPRGGDVHTMRVPRHELIVDPVESKYGKTRTLARVYLEDRDVVAKLYPAHAEAIKMASRASRDEWSPYEYDISSDPDQVELICIWRLPTQKGEDDGKFIVGIRGLQPLQECTWKVPRFPFAGMHYTAPVRGFFGTGLVRALAPLQSKVNDVHRSIQEDIYWGGSMKWVVPRGSNVNKNHLRTRHPAVLEHDGVAPQIVPGNPISRDATDYLRWLIQQMYELSGVSQASAQSKNPLGPNASGKALDTMYDMESDRFSHVEMQYAMFRVDIGQCILDVAQQLAEDHDSDDEDAPELAKWITEIDWAKFDVDGGNYHLNLEPINFLPDARAGKLDTVSDMGKAGILSDPIEAAALFDEPDIARANRHLLGPYRYCEKTMEMLADLSVPLEDCTPTPQMPPALAKKMALGELGNAAAEGAEDVVLGRFRWFLQMLEGEAATAAAAATPQPGAMPGATAPPGAGAPPPMPGAPPPMMPPLPGNGLGGMDAQAAAGMPMPNMSQGMTQ